MMAGVTTLIVVYVLVVSVFSAGQHYDWSPCSRTCGQGTKSRKCQPNDVRSCQYEYADCKVKDCPIVQCTTYKYDSDSDCCSNEDPKKCGVPQIGAGVFRRRIIGGNLSEDGQWPWQVALRKKKTNKFVCGAALLNERWIVTAAHCFTDPGGIKHAKDALIVAGISRLKGENPGKQTFDMEKFIIHPSNTYYTNDVALAKTTMPARYSAYVHPICLPGGEEVTQDTICYVAGWGIASVQGPEIASTDLLHVGLRVLPLGACEEAYRGDPSSHSITNEVICAGILSGDKDSCTGDSGGPLVCQRMKSCQWFMAGVVSFGYTTCGAKGAPAVYVNVQKYQEWIDMTMKKNSISVPEKWEPCSKTCGGGMQLKIEKCSASGGADCPKNYRGCNAQPCPTIPEKWQPCSKTCGGGTQLKIEKCSASGSADCPKNYRGCNIQPCPAINCSWMEYSKYGRCEYISDGSGGYAYMKKRQRLQIKALHGGAPCVGNDHEYARCSSVEITGTLFMRTITTAFPAAFKQAPSTNNRDVLFLLDESGSVGSHNFKERFVRFAKAVVGSFCGKISIGKTTTRVGVMNFDRNQYPEIDFDDYFSKAQLLAGMDTEIEYHQLSSGTTCLVDALRFARTGMFHSARGSRLGVNGAERIVILVTDGCANCQRNTRLKSDLEVVGRRFSLQGIPIITFLVTGNPGYCFDVMRGLSDGWLCYQQFHAPTWTAFDNIIKVIEERDCIDAWYSGPMC